MSDHNTKNITISIPRSLMIVGLVAGSIGVLEIVLSTIAYANVKPGFDLLATYLSDIGATPVWPQIFFNAGMLIVSPLRYIVLALLVFRTYKLGVGRTFGRAVLLIGVFTTLGTIIMAAVPYTVDVTIHKLGIPLFFFGGIILIFFTLEMLYQADIVSRNIPILWEWLCGISVVIWVFAHSIILGRYENSVDFPLIT